MTRGVLAVCGAALLLWASRIAPAELAAGGGGGGWFIMGTPLGSALMHMPPDAPPGTVRRAATLNAEPRLLAAEAGRAILIFGPMTPDNGERVWAVRACEPRVADRPAELSALPPLTTRGVPTSVIAAAGEAWVIVEQANAPRSLLRLDRHGWHAVEWPEGCDPRRGVRLVAFAGAVSLWQDEERGERATLWRRYADEGREGWSSRPMSALAGAEPVGEVGGQLIAAERDRLGGLVLFLQRPEGRARIAAAIGASAEQWVVPLSSGVAIVNSDGAALPRLTCQIFSPTGAVVYDGAALTRAAVSAEELVLLALVLGSLLATALVFIFRPEAARRDAVTLPAGFALAGPERRVAAGLLDAAFALAAGATGHALMVTAAPDAVGRFGEAWSVILAIALVSAVAMGTVGEAFGGRSPGKALLGCRVVTTAGLPVTFGQALARNVVRFLCPPLGMAWMLQPPGAAGGLFGTVVIAAAPPGPTADDSGDST